ncbi:nuclear transport factor 2 family protein [Frankia sp. Cr2]|uniref:nuclear transport factor 2 family protein n=1 Tax=Frankia sp. Cr2 TaxID=3073932 RepID=UPI002AD23F37|nr:nuclear transport factor 2 family protein [Frankia sp. Cr2]
MSGATAPIPGERADPGRERAEILSLAIRFADLWAVDPHQMADEIYAPSIHMESMARTTVVDGIDMLHRLEERLATMVPEHRHELVRVLVDQPEAFLETTVVSPTTGEYAQAALWWRVGEPAAGQAVRQVVDEVGWFDWAHRRADSTASRGTVPPDDRRWRGGTDWYHRLVSEAAAAFSADPAAAASRYLSADPVATHVGHTEISGRGPVLDAVERFSAVLSRCRIEVSRVIGDGAVVAVLFTLGNATTQTRGTLVATLDADGAAHSVRLYLDWDCVAADGQALVPPRSDPAADH